MSSLVDYFRRPLPLVMVEDIKKEVRRKVEASLIIQKCRSGDHQYIKSFNLGYWPLVDTFLLTVNWAQEDVSRALNPDQLTRRFGKSAISEFDQLSTEAISTIRRDETDHRTLWRYAAESIGLTYDDLKAYISSPEVSHLINVLRDNTDLYAQFIRFAAVEIVAEEVSRALIKSTLFTTFVKAQEWFNEHIRHNFFSGMCHEELAWRVAFTLRFIFTGEENFPRKEEVCGIIYDTVDLFDAVGNKCCEHARTA